MLRVDHVDGTFVLMADCVGGGADVELVNRFLAHLGTRNFSTATRRAYGYDLLNFLRFLDGRGATLAAVRPTDLFDWHCQLEQSEGDFRRFTSAIHQVACDV